MHEPVLLEEVLEALKIRPDGRYVDGTLGQAGHAVAIASRLTTGKLLGLDVDEENLRTAEDRLQPLGDRTLTRRVNFRGLQEILRDVGWTEVDGMLFDLGVSTGQLTGPRLSFDSDAPLDFRIDPAAPDTGASFLARADESSLTHLFAEYGEPRAARRLSRTVLAEFSAGRLKTNADLARLCERIIGRRGPRHPATRVFLAIRAAVNDEMGVLRQVLDAAPRCLAVGGRLAVITFHSLEDRAAKERFRALAHEGENGRAFALINKKPIVPSRGEQARNPRSRSAKLRVLERVS